ncbi:hypothetical protein VW29_00855 [Devosia limi DSM 17137]|uniref:Molybdenum cofactor cytidylyltransferase n=1 Tax=Devosia limi DSM 17137 TaxID=1121477 RepID=A0A0F5LWL2_9HYPH|nr:nucleotidyltransferase family protein [Devosia limi]KKB86681.1 hypothetical protein VW29_00855 [Devosia limi DSM 17137]SHE85609.1 molybdenum cofactor cytidylyltransferase [Devosia limi DSM 17137]
MPSLEAMAGVLLASGLSRRFGASKLVAELGGRPLAFWAIDCLASVPLAERSMVHGPHTDTELLDYARHTGLALVENADAALGMGGSIAAGFGAVNGVSHAFLALADMPFVRPDDYRALASALEQAPEKSIAAPLFEGRRGHPVLFARQHFPALRLLQGDKGGGAIIRANGPALAQVRSRNRGVLIDIDTPAALAEAEDYALALSE